jgi:hypothetical protein
MRLFLLLLTFFAPLAARASVWEITALAGANYSAPTETRTGGSLDWTGNAALTYGGSVSYELFDTPFELESGLFVVSSENEGSVNNAATVRKMTSLQIPILLRFNFDPWISIAAGGYFSSAKGNVETVINGGSVSRQSYDTVGLKTSDEGLLLGLKAKLHISAPLSLVFDVRYQHGLKNVAVNSGETYNTRSIQALAGFGFEFETSSVVATPPNSKNHSSSE